jgi:hypothetical protein
MFCSKCQSEYRGSYTECPQCKVLLIEKLQSEDRLENSHSVYLMTATDGIQAHMVKSILEEHGICSFTREYLDDFLPGAFAGTLAARPFSCPVAIQVLSADLDEACRVLKTAGDIEI